MSRLFVIKIGGNIVDNESKLAQFLSDLSSIEDRIILIHGGGKIATALADKMGVEQTMVNGRRITDASTLEIVTMVYAGLINKNIVAQLQANGCNAIGLSGADGNTILSHKRTVALLDYGYVGDVDMVNTSVISALLQAGLVPVFSAITHDGKGQLLNTNADTVAQEIATAMAKEFKTTLIYSFEKEGVLLDVDDDASVIPHLSSEYYEELKAESKIFAGMIPKLDNAFSAVSRGIDGVIIGKAEKIKELTSGKTGTLIK
ncbi:MAG: acetylglutamate kinase [Saprospiraceae bacterium]|nr:acetylglutamate kinase [Saprospiraceae bacterium]